MWQADTFIMGSSMGGLISAYAVAEYPEVYGGAACLSTAWTAMDGAKSEWHNDVDRDAHDGDYDDDNDDDDNFEAMLEEQEREDKAAAELAP